MLSSTLLILAVAVFSVGLRSFHHPIPQKLGALGIFVTSFLVGWLYSGMWIIGVICAGSWLLLPWLEILTRIRKLRLPLEKNLRPRSAPALDIFPALDELTAEVEEDHFAQVEDAGWDWEDSQQFFRLFYKETARTQAAICLIDQQNLAFYYLSVSSRGKDGTIWTTWNYPFSYSLKLIPELRINRLRSDVTFFELYESHQQFLLENRVKPEDLEALDPEEIATEIQRDLRLQIAHNLAAGVLTQAGEGYFRYSWRGMIYIYCQFLRDLVRL